MPPCDTGGLTDIKPAETKTRRNQVLMSKTLIYTMAAGRSGAGYLARLYRENLPDATVYHQRFAFDAFGAVTPELSHLMTFNTLGNSPYVEKFWKRKISWDLARSNQVFAETSHLSCQGGLLENIDHAASQAQVRIVFLERDIVDVAWSLLNGFDLANPGAQLLQALDSRYSNVLVPAGDLKQWGGDGEIIWYLMEMRCRAEYYRLLLADRPNISLHTAPFSQVVTPEGAQRLLLETTGFQGDVSIPGKPEQPKPVSYSQKRLAAVQDLVQRVRFDAKSRAARLFSKGRRLADPLAGATQTQLDDLFRSGSAVD